MKNKEVGKTGEAYAIRFLIARGYDILEENFYSRFGEVDIIAEKEWALAFIEVKTRTSEAYGMPEECITNGKIERIQKTALHFLDETRGKNHHDLRIDLIVVKLNKDYDFIDLKHIKNITNG